MAVNSVRHGFLCNNSVLQIFGKRYDVQNSVTYEPKSDRRDLLAIKVKSEIFTEKVVNTSIKFGRGYLYK